MFHSRNNFTLADLQKDVWLLMNAYPQFIPDLRHRIERLPGENGYPYRGFVVLAEHTTPKTTFPGTSSHPLFQTQFYNTSK